MDQPDMEPLPPSLQHLIEKRLTATRREQDRRDASNSQEVARDQRQTERRKTPRRKKT